MTSVQTDLQGATHHKTAQPIRPSRQVGIVTIKAVLEALSGLMIAQLWPPGDTRSSTPLSGFKKFPFADCSAIAAPYRRTGPGVSGGIR